MAGHSKFANIKHRKAAQDKKRSKAFSRVVREIEVAAKNNPDPSSNPKLRSALIAARAVNLPKDRIQKAIKKSETDPSNYEELRYEGYGVAGVAFIIEILTDNKNRAASNIRAIFTKHGGSMAETGSVSFMFQKLGCIEYPSNKIEEMNIFNDAIELGASDLEKIHNEESDTEVFQITTDIESFANVRDGLIKNYGDPSSLGFIWKAENLINLNVNQATSTIKITEALEDLDDVSAVFNNALISPEIYAEI